MFENIATQVEIVEVGPRDGFQNVKTFIPTRDKLSIIYSLVEAGIKSFEIASFVSPKAIPQMADAKEICHEILNKYGNSIEAIALVPNLRGAKLAWDAGIHKVVWPISVTEAHNKANTNRTHAESLAELQSIRNDLPDMKIQVGLAMTFACPFMGWTDPEQVGALIEKLIDKGIEHFVLADTIGVATPDKVYNVSYLMQKRFPRVKFNLHLHDTRGLGLVNAVAGLTAGITTLESSVGGLGGCPFAPGAAGNTATEDMVNMLENMNIKTGIDLQKLLKTAKLIQDKVDAALSSRMSNAKIYDCCGTMR